MRRIFLLPTTFFALLFSINTFSQTPTPTPSRADDNEGVVKISTNLIQIDATVTDKSGNIVKNLKPEDFEIYENGEKRTITDFSFVEVQNRKASNQTITAGKSEKSAVPFPSGAVELRPENVRRTVALIVDDLGLSFSNVLSVKTALRKFVDEQMQPDDLVAIIRTGGGAGLEQQFTSDKRILYRAIDKLHWNPAGAGKMTNFGVSDPSDAGAPPDASSRDLSQETQAQQTRSRNTSASGQQQFDSYQNSIFQIGSLGAVNYIIKGMRELPGRKAVILLSEGFALYDLDNGIKKPNPRLMDDFRRLTEQANRSSVIIYGMDVRGLVVPMPGAEENVIASDGGGKFSMGEGMTASQSATLQSTGLMETQQGLRALSAGTGGFAIVNNNNLAKGIERALNDQSGYYLLGYQPDEESFDPSRYRFNTITVKLKRPDLRVRYRNGFFGIDDKDVKEPVQTPQQQLVAALNSPVVLRDIDLQLTSLFANDAQTGNFMRSLVYINGKDLQFNNDGNGWEKATLDIVVLTFGENGKVVDQISRTENIRARSETLRELREKGFVSTITIPIKEPGAYQMRLVIRDASTSKIGSASQFIEVPDLKKNSLTLSGILLQRVQSPTGSYQNTSSGKEFQSDEQRDVAIRSFHSGMNVRFGYAIYNAKFDKTKNAPNLTMQFRIFHDGKQTFASKEKAPNFTDKSDIARMVAEGVFTLGKEIQPGDYILQVIVRDLSKDGKNQFASQWIDFEVVQ